VNLRGPRAALLLAAASTAGCRDRITEFTAPFAVSATAEVPVATGIGESCAVRDDGRVACWPGADPGRATAYPGEAVAVAVGCDFACAIRPGRSVDCWVTDPGRTLPLGDVLSVPPDLGPVRSLAASCSRACAARADGSVWCWGSGGEPPAGLPPVTRLAVGDGGGCGIAEAGGTVACWREGSLAISLPTSGLPSAADLTGMEDHFCAVLDDGTGHCWGANASSSSSVPTGLGPLRSLSAGWNSTCALDTAGQVACDGWLGDRLNVPGATRVFTGLFDLCVLPADRRLLCWSHPLY
jgi:hypothetical protein